MVMCGRGVLPKVRGKRYYLNPDEGHLLKDCWVTVNGKKYGLSKTGEVYSEVTESEIDVLK